MKIILASDLHSQPKCINYLNKIISKYNPDGLIISGDICNGNDFNYWNNLKKVLNRSQIQIFIIWGNNEGEQIINEIIDSKFCIHLKEKELSGFKFFGIGETDQPIRISPQSISGSILITHRPPLKTAITKPMPNAPLAHISGHLHSVAKLTQYPSTTHISVPTLQDGLFAIFDPEDMSVRFSKMT